MYRLLAAPLLMILIFTNQLTLFKWLLPISFFTDAIDGMLARKFHVASRFGAKLDSYADDLTVIAGVVGLFFFRWDFVKQEYLWLVITFGFFVLQTTASFIKYRSITHFHTWLAKTAAVFQGIFLISAFFLETPIKRLFHTAAIITSIELIEEMIIVFLLAKPRSNVKTLFHIILKKQR